VNAAEDGPDRTYPTRVVFSVIGWAVILWVMVSAIGWEGGVGWSLWSVGLVAVMLLPIWNYMNSELGQTPTVVAGVLLLASAAVFLLPNREQLRTLDDGLDGISIFVTFVVQIAIVTVAVAFERRTRSRSS
jgi:hypothetical protein